jgi:tRNA(fMet)-specific endonuclease VapC
MGTLIDTSTVIAFERNELQLDDRSLVDDEVAMSVITVSELWHGVERADTPLRRAAREEFLRSLFDRIPVVPIDYDIARKHAQIAAQLAKAGAPIGVHDSWIAATALVIGAAVATRNVRHFERVEGLRVMRR